MPASHETSSSAEAPPSPDVVVDRVRLYHGSPVGDIGRLDAAEEFTVGEGVYFTPGPEPAISYAHERTRRQRNAKDETARPVLYAADIEDARFADLRNDENIGWLLRGLTPELERVYRTSTDWKV